MALDAFVFDAWTSGHGPSLRGSTIDMFVGSSLFFTAMAACRWTSAYMSSCLRRSHHTEVEHAFSFDFCGMRHSQMCYAQVGPLALTDPVTSIVHLVPQGADSRLKVPRFVCVLPRITVRSEIRAGVRNNTRAYLQGYSCPDDHALTYPDSIGNQPVLTPRCTGQPLALRSIS